MEELRVNIKDDYTISMRCVLKGLMFSWVGAFREAVLFNSEIGRMGQYGDRRILSITRSVFLKPCQ